MGIDPIQMREAMRAHLRWQETADELMFVERHGRQPRPPPTSTAITDMTISTVETTAPTTVAKASKASSRGGSATSIARDYGRGVRANDQTGQDDIIGSRGGSATGDERTVKDRPCGGGESATTTRKTTNTKTVLKRSSACNAPSTDGDTATTSRMKHRKTDDSTHGTHQRQAATGAGALPCYNDVSSGSSRPTCIHAELSTAAATLATATNAAQNARNFTDELENTRYVGSRGPGRPHGARCRGGPATDTVNETEDEKAKDTSTAAGDSTRRASSCRSHRDTTQGTATPKPANWRHRKLELAQIAASEKRRKTDDLQPKNSFVACSKVVIANDSLGPNSTTSSSAAGGCVGSDHGDCEPWNGRTSQRQGSEHTRQLRVSLSVSESAAGNPNAVVDKRAALLARIRAKEACALSKQHSSI